MIYQAEKTIKIASRLYEAHDSAKMLYGAGYQAKIAEAQEIIRETMAMHRCEALPAAMSLVTELQKDYSAQSARSQCLVMAAYVEMAEPSAVPA